MSPLPDLFREAEDPLLPRLWPKVDSMPPDLVTMGANERYHGWYGYREGELCSARTRFWVAPAVSLELFPFGLPDLVALLGELMKSALKSGQTLDRAGSGPVGPSMTRQRGIVALRRIGSKGQR